MSHTSNIKDCKNEKENKDKLVVFNEIKNIYDYTEYQTFYEHKYKQGCKEWLDARDSVIITGTSSSITINLNAFSSTFDLMNKRVKEITPEQKVKMDNGHLFEPYLRQYLELFYKIKIKETGFIIPKFDTDIGTSLDGLTDDAIIEIKTSDDIPFILQRHKQQLDMGFSFDQYYHQHIFASHYCQMQHNMACVGKKVCIYLVFGIQSGKIYIEKVPFNQQFWSEVLYPGERQFIENYKMLCCDIKQRN
jgi:hypothetical protein